MGEAREGMTERAEQQDVLGRVRQVVLTADHVADLHRGVIDDDREVVERIPVGTDDHEVPAEVGDVDLDPTPHDVFERDPPRPDPETERPRAPFRLACATFVGRQVGAAPDIARRELGRLLGLAIGLELFGRAVARVRQILEQQPAVGVRVCAHAQRPFRRAAAAARRPRSWAAAPSGDTGRAGRARARRPPRAPRPSRARASAARRGCPSRTPPCCALGRCPRVAG